MRVVYKSAHVIIKRKGSARVHDYIAIILLQLGLVLIKGFQITRKRCFPHDWPESTGLARVIIVVTPVSRGVA